MSPSRGTQSQTEHAERRIIYCSAEIYRRYQKYTDITGCNAGEKKMITGTWMVVRYVDFARFTILNERPPDGYTWSRERLTRKQTTSRPDILTKGSFTRDEWDNLLHLFNSTSAISAPLAALRIPA